MVDGMLIHGIRVHYHLPRGRGPHMPLLLLFFTQFVSLSLCLCVCVRCVRPVVGWLGLVASCRLLLQITVYSVAPVPFCPTVGMVMV